VLADKSRLKRARNAKVGRKVAHHMRTSFKVKGLRLRSPMPDATSNAKTGTRLKTATVFLAVTAQHRHMWTRKQNASGEVGHNWRR